VNPLPGCILILFLLTALPAVALERVTLQLKWKHQFQFAGYYAALEKGYYREAGLDVTIVEQTARENSLDAVLNGRADYGIGASDLALHRAQGKPVVALACIIQHSPLVLFTSVRIQSIKDLTDKRIMLLPEETELFAFLTRSGVERNRIVEVPHSFDIDALTSGRVDALSGYSTDEAYDLQSANFTYHQFSPRSVDIDFYGDTLFTTQKHLKEHPSQVVAFREASLRGWQYALAHSEEVIELIRSKYSQRHSLEHLRFEAAETARLMQPDLVEIGSMNPERWRKIADMYASLGMTPHEFEIEGFIYDPRPVKLPAWVNTSLLSALAALLLFSILVWRYARLNRNLNRALVERDQALAERRANEEQLRVVLDTAPVAVITWRKGFVLTGWNREAQRTFGWTKEEVLERNFFDFMVPEAERPQVQAITDGALDSDFVAHSVNHNLTKDGRTIFCAWSNAMFHDPAGNPAGVISIALDITERTQAEEALHAANIGLQTRLEQIQALQARLEELAVRDSLTGLYNRRYLDETLEREVARARREGHPLSLLMIDVDHFKQLNDNYGHRAGDKVLRMLSELLLADTRTEDVACRYGGEEFLVLLPGMPADKARQRAETWRRDIENAAVVFEGHALKITASFGIACYPEHGQDPDQLTGAADAALYEAKHRGRNRVECLQGHFVG